MVEIKFAPDERLEGTRIGVITLENARVGPTEFSFERKEKRIFGEMRKRYSIEELKHDTRIRGFRDLYWSFGMDPTKLRISSEALLRRILQEKNLWRINNAVDAVNLISAETGLPISAWDYARLRLPIEIRTAKKGEAFFRIGADSPLILKGHELVVADQEKILTLGFASTDCEACKITVDTEWIMLAVYAVKEVSDLELLQAMKRIMNHMEEFVDCDARRTAVVGPGVGEVAAEGESG